MVIEPQVGAAIVAGVARALQDARDGWLRDADARRLRRRLASLLLALDGDDE